MQIQYVFSETEFEELRQNYQRIGQFIGRLETALNEGRSATALNELECMKDYHHNIGEILTDI